MSAFRHRAIALTLIAAAASCLLWSQQAPAQRLTGGRVPGGPGDPVAKARPGDVRLMVSGAIEIPLEAVRDELQRVAGHPLVIQYGSARGNLKDEILAGQAFEVALLLPDVVERLIDARKVDADTVEIARVQVAIGQRGGGPLVDVGTPEALRLAMLRAKSLRWLPTGVALPTVNKILDTLAIRDAVISKHNIPGAVPLQPGEFELQIYPLSEILGSSEVRSLGTVIPSLQVPAVITAVIGTNTSDRRAAEAVVAFLRGPALLKPLEASGMTR